METETVINLNNQTVAMLEQQDPLNAVQSSADALRCCGLLSKMQGNPIICSTTQGEGAKEDCIDRCMTLPQSLQKVSDRENTFIYKHGIVLPPTATDMKMISTIAIFNSAIAHHLLAEEGTSKQRFLNKTKKLYELAYMATERHENPVFQFALINNIGVIERQLGNVAASNQYFDCLSSLLESIENC